MNFSKHDKIATSEVAEKRRVYLDYNATTPMAPEVVEAVHHGMVHLWGNPSSHHCEGHKACDAIEKARNQIASMISASGREIIFMSGGTEANNTVIHSALTHFSKWSCGKDNRVCNSVKPHVITTAVEHDSVKLPVIQRCSKEADVTYLSLDNLPDAVMDAIRPSTCLITVMLANNETGIMLPVAHIARRLAEVNRRRESSGLFRILLHTDAAQAIGKTPVDSTDLNVDYLTIVGHKFYGPRIGALYVRGLGTMNPCYPLLYGGGQETGYRSGTENTPMIVGLGIAASLVDRYIKEYHSHMKKMRNHLERLLKCTFGSAVKVNCLEPCLTSDPEKCKIRPKEKSDQHFIFPRLPNTSSISFYYKEVTGRDILRHCELLDASVGAACHSQGDTPSTLEASGVCSYHARRTLRLSVGRETTIEDVKAAVDDINKAVQLLLASTTN